jgi:hypothetical protein
MRTTGHWISFFMTLCLMTALIIFLFRGRSRRFGKGNNWHIYGPTILAVLATILIMADLWRHVLQDTNVWPEKVFLGMKQSDIVVGFQNSSSSNSALVDQYYAPSNGVLSAGSLAISNQVFIASEFNVTMCFDRPVQSGHYDAKDESFVIWAIGPHAYTFGSITHAADEFSRGDSNPTIDWLTADTKNLTLSDPAAINQVELSWTVNAKNTALSICLSATGPQVSRRTWVGLGFTTPLGIGSSQYVVNPDRNCLHSNNERIACLSTIGFVFTILFTYTGFVLLAVATMWNANITQKIRKFREKWKEIREKK